MKIFYRFALASTVATYFLIFIGGLVRVSGAGLGCPDWPKCFGRWFPPTDISQLPPEIDPAQFNFVLAWIEYVNRLIGMAVGLMIAITAIWALIGCRKYNRIVIPALMSAILVAYQGWQGGRMIASHLEPILVSIHMGLAFLIAALMLYLTQQAYYVTSDRYYKKSASVPGHLRLWLFLLMLVSIVQVIIGTQVRTAMENTIEQYPLLAKSQVLTQVGIIHPLHIVLGVIVTLVSWQVGVRIVRQLPPATMNVSQGAWTIMLLAAVQVILGVFMAVLGAPGVLQLFHLLLSALFIGMLVFLFSALRHEGDLS